MKKIFILALIGCVAWACTYDEIAPMDYEEGQLYLPAAVNGIYTIDALTKEPMTPNPTPGYAVRCVLNREANKLEIPLSVYRGGVNYGNQVTASLSVYADTLAQMIDDETLTADVVLLPEGKFSLPNTVTLAGGTNSALFTLAIDLDFLVETSPTLYVLPVKISSADMRCNPALSTAIVVIDSKIAQ